MPPDAENVTSPARILQILDQLHHLGFELFAKAPGDEAPWRTSISKADADTGRVIYHQLTPATWQLADLAEPLELHCLEPGCRLLFRSVLTPAGEASVNYFESDLPHQLLYHQLRKQYRISLATRRTGISLSFNECTWTGELINISEGGCRARVNADKEVFAAGQHIERCRIWVDESLDIQCEVEVRHRQAMPQQLELSLAFRSLAPQHAQRLRRSLAALQRANLRQGVASIG